MQEERGEEQQSRDDRHGEVHATALGRPASASSTKTTPRTSDTSGPATRELADWKFSAHSKANGDGLAADALEEVRAELLALGPSSSWH